MGISGTFVADFSSFQAAVDQSVAKLADFSAGSDKVQASLNKMVDSFSGVKVIQQATLMTQAITDLGGATTLTASEQAKVNDVVQAGIDKYAALGQVAPPAMLELAAATEQSSGGFLEGIPLVEGFVAAFSVEKILSFGEAILSSASDIENLSRATGVSTDGIQQLAYVGASFGITTDQMARGVEDLSARLAGGNSSAASAVAGLGLSLSALIDEGPQQAFIDIATAVGNVKDPMLQASVNTDLFGKFGKILLPVMKDLATAFANAQKNAQVISQDNIDKVAAFDAGWAHLTQTFKAVTATSFGAVIDAFNDMNAAIAKQSLAEQDLDDETVKMGATFLGLPLRPVADGLLDMVNSTLQFGGAISTAVTPAQYLANQLNDLRTKALAPLSDAQKDNIIELQSFGQSLDNIAQLVGSNAVAVKLFEDAHRSAEAELKKFQTALAEVESAGQTWQETLDTIDGSIVDTISNDLKAGVSQEALAKTYALTAAQVRSVALANADQVAQQKKSDDAILETTKLWDDYDALIGSASQGSYAAASAAIDKWAADLTAKMQKAGTDTAEFYDALAADEDARYAKLNTTTLAADALSQQYYAKQMATAADYYAFLQAQQANGVQISTASINAARTAADAATQAYNQWTTGITAATATSDAALRSMADAAQTSFLSVGKTVSDTFAQMTTDALNASKTIAGYFGSETPAQLQSLQQAAGINYNPTANLGGAGTLGLGLVGGSGSAFPPAIQGVYAGAPASGGQQGGPQGPALFVPNNNGSASTGSTTHVYFQAPIMGMDASGKAAIAQMVSDAVTQGARQGNRYSG